MITVYCVVSFSGMYKFSYEITEEIAS